MVCKGGFLLLAVPAKTVIALLFLLVLNFQPCQSLEVENTFDLSSQTPHPHIEHYLSGKFLHTNEMPRSEESRTWDVK